MTVEDTIYEALRLTRRYSRSDSMQKITEVMDMVGLTAVCAWHIRTSWMAAAVSGWGLPGRWHWTRSS